MDKKMAIGFKLNAVLDELLLIDDKMKFSFCPQGGEMTPIPQPGKAKFQYSYWQMY